MYSAFVKFRLTDLGSKIALDHQSDTDSHKVYEKFSALEFKPTKAFLN